METARTFESLQPRLLKYRAHYKWYLAGMVFVGSLLIAYCSYLIYIVGVDVLLKDYQPELLMTGSYFALSIGCYFFWLRHKLTRSVQVHKDGIDIHHGTHREKILYSDIEVIAPVARSMFYLKMKSGVKHYFNSSLERIDYVWEGLYFARPDLFGSVDFEGYRVKLVQYDHHQKRKEWFFKHKFVDVFQWVIIPAVFILVTYKVQSQYVQINQFGLYVFRLSMFSLLSLLVCTFLYSFVLKKVLFDKKIKDQMVESGDKVRDLDYESLIVQRSKMLQTMTACFVLAVLVRMDMNLFSVTRLKDDIAMSNLTKGKTVLIDNRYNCYDCRFAVRDGDWIVYGRGQIGQVMAKSGETVAQISQDKTGRMIASTDMMEVPEGHIAVRIGNQGQDVLFIKATELVGKIQK